MFPASQLFLFCRLSYYLKKRKRKMCFPTLLKVRNSSWQLRALNPCSGVMKLTVTIMTSTRIRKDSDQTVTRASWPENLNWGFFFFYTNYFCLFSVELLESCFHLPGLCSVKCIHSQNKTEQKMGGAQLILHFFSWLISPALQGGVSSLTLLLTQHKNFDIARLGKQCYDVLSTLLFAILPP